MEESLERSDPENKLKNVSQGREKNQMVQVLLIRNRTKDLSLDSAMEVTNDLDKSSFDRLEDMKA